MAPVSDAVEAIQKVSSSSQDCLKATFDVLEKFIGVFDRVAEVSDLFKITQKRGLIFAHHRSTLS